MTTSHEADVVVVGAGLAGLMTAHRLLKAGLEPLVFEARDRVGGRVLSEPIGDGKINEMGGQWTQPSNPATQMLTKDLGLEFFQTYDQGASILEVSDRIRRYRGTIPRLRPAALIDLGIARWRLDRQARQVPAAAPWEAPQAQEWDHQTLGTWLEHAVRTREGRLVLGVGISTIWGAEPSEVNLLQALSYINRSGGFDDHASTTNGGFLQYRVVGGSAVIAQRLAARLGDRVVTNRPVVAIVDRGTSVDVDAGGVRASARRVVVALPPRLASEVLFDPDLPSVRRRALESLPMGSMTKVAAIYDRPFWRDRGLSGKAVSVRGPVTATFDNSPPEGRPGVLIGFVPGIRGRDLATRPPAERRAAVLGSLQRFFGAEAARPEKYLEKNWSEDPWTRGCYFGLATPGSLTGPLRTLADPINGIHWAGAETEYRFYGGMDGALYSGLRAANEVLAALTPATGKPA